MSRSLIGGWGPDLLDIGRVSLRRNADRGVTGALYFDGERFAQVLEGPWAEVTLLLEAIRRDPRHFDVRTVEDSAARARRFQNWHMRFVDRPEAPEVSSLLMREPPGPALAHELVDRLAAS